MFQWKFWQQINIDEEAVLFEWIFIFVQLNLTLEVRKKKTEKITSIWTILDEVVSEPFYDVEKIFKKIDETILQIKNYFFRLFDYLEEIFSSLEQNSLGT